MSDFWNWIKNFFIPKQQAVVSAIAPTMLSPAKADPVVNSPPISGTLPVGKKILDISRYQGLVNFSEIDKTQYIGVFIKATEGESIVDSLLYKNYEAARAAGWDVGFYHFLHIKSPISAQIANFKNSTKSLVVSPVLGCAVDLEWDDGLQAAGEAGAQAALEFMAAVPDPVVYTAPGFFYGITPETLAKFAAYRLWLAQYGVSKPKIPAPWTKYWAWQFTSQSKVPGINGPCDVSLIG